jgi:hypothetical protein
MEGFPPRTPLSQNLRKPQNWAPLLTDFREGSQGKEPRRVRACIPNQIPKRKVSNPPQENHQEKALKITKKENGGNQHNALRNHVESFVHNMKVHTRFSLPTNHPSLSKDLTIKLSS